MVRAFAAAARCRNLAGLVAVRDPQVVLRSDGGGVVTAARKPVLGNDHVARFILGVLQKRPDLEVTEQEPSDGLGFAIWEDGPHRLDDHTRGRRRSCHRRQDDAQPPEALTVELTDPAHLKIGTAGLDPRPRSGPDAQTG